MVAAKVHQGAIHLARHIHQALALAVVVAEEVAAAVAVAAGKQNFKMGKNILLTLFLFELVINHTVPVITGSKASQKDAQVALDFHNKIRKDVKTNNLEWSVELAKYAQEWADYLASNNKFQHRTNSGMYKQLYGENIFYGYGKDYKLIDACEDWYSEIRYYKKNVKLTKQNWSKAGHYTQMVWSKSTKVGIGIAKAKNGKTYIVANYSPAGNMMGEKPY